MVNVHLGPSDIRLKRDIVEIARLDNGIGIYRYRYVWSDQVYVGVIAQEVETIAPQAVYRGADGYLRVIYSRLGCGPGRSGRRRQRTTLRTHLRARTQP